MKTVQPPSGVATHRQHRVGGVCGIIGAAFLLVLDWIMLGAPSSGSDFTARWFDILCEMPSWRLTVGGLAAPVGALFYIIGFWQVYLALRPGHRRLAFVCFPTQAISFIGLAAFHAAFPLAAYLNRLHDAVGMPGETEELYSASMAYFGRMYYFALAFGLVGAVLLFVLPLFGRTSYPRWIVVAHLAVLWAGCYFFRFLPAPIGRPLFIGSGNIAHLVFFVISTAVLWHGGTKIPEEMDGRDEWV